MLDPSSRLSLSVGRPVPAKSIAVLQGNGHESDRLLVGWVGRLLPLVGEELERTLNTSPKTSFAEAVGLLSPGGRKQLGDRLGERGLEELLSLSREADPEMFAAAYLNFAGRQEQAGRVEVAALTYATLSQTRPTTESAGESVLGLRNPRAPVFSDQIRRSAQQRLEVLLGRGPTGLRFEKLIDHFCEQSADPAMLGGMMLASTVFQGARAFGLSRLLVQSEALWWTRGAGARFLASALGFSAEVPTFLVSSKLLHQSMGIAQDWSPKALGREGLSLGLGLALLKGFGVASRYGIDWLDSYSSLGHYSRTFLPALGGVAGIYLANRVEQGLGLRAKTDAATSLTDSLVFFLQCEIGGSLSRRLMGSRWNQALQELDLRSERVTPRPTPDAPNAAELAAFMPAKRIADAATATDFLKEPKVLPHSGSKKAAGPEQVLMQQDGESGHGVTKFFELRLAGLLRQRVQRETPKGSQESTLKQAVRVSENFAATSGADLGRYFEMLRSSEVQDIRFEEGRVMTWLQQLDVATDYFRYVMEMNPLRRDGGSLYDHLVQEAFERTLREGDAAKLSDLVQVVSIGRKTQSVEEFFRHENWLERYQFQGSLWSNKVTQQCVWARQLKALNLSKSAQDAVGNFLATFSYGEPARPFRDSNYNHILLRSETGDFRREPLTVDIAVQALGKYLQQWRRYPEYLKVLEGAIQRAAKSPVPLLYFDRIFKVLATGDIPWKLMDISSPDNFDWGKLLGAISLSDQEDGYDTTAAKLNGTVYTGYVWDMTLAKKFAMFYDHVHILNTPVEQNVRMKGFRSRAKTLLDQKPGKGKPNFDRNDVLELLYERPTYVATRAREAILKGEVELLILPKGEPRPGAPLPPLQKQLDRSSLWGLWQSIDHQERGKTPPQALFVPASKNPEGKPIIAVTELDPTLSYGQKIAQAVRLVAHTVHEFEHFLHSKELTFTSREQILRSEMRSWLEEIFYLMHQGDSTEWNRVEALSPYGFGVYLRNLIDKDYIEGPRDLVFHR